jgi:hypothetical protein
MQNWLLPFLTSHFSPVQGSVHAHENVCFLSSDKQEPPLRHPVMRQPWIEIKWNKKMKNCKCQIVKIFVAFTCIFCLMA